MCVNDIRSEVKAGTARVSFTGELRRTAIRSTNTRRKKKQERETERSRVRCSRGLNHLLIRAAAEGGLCCYRQRKDVAGKSEAVITRGESTYRRLKDDEAGLQSPGRTRVRRRDWKCRSKRCARRKGGGGERCIVGNMAMSLGSPRHCRTLMSGGAGFKSPEAMVYQEEGGGRCSEQSSFPETMV
ncbi:hypothetical protein L2E82_30885 [Cichorium intybus]|uniref:Uncharacterized protein n=1 Tax=Cichorium intybus TaxID=13427 RepID=A0ACB9D227_CICIN|nr:hypothetical protein L2E82_30885 [Cichorium intybus]